MGFQTALAAIIANLVYLFAPLLKTIASSSDGRRWVEYSSIGSHFTHTWSAYLFIAVLVAHAAATVAFYAGARLFYQRHYAQGLSLMRAMIPALILVCALIFITDPAAYQVYVIPYTCACLLAIAAVYYAGRDSGLSVWGMLSPQQEA